MTLHIIHHLKMLKVTIRCLHEDMGGTIVKVDDRFYGIDLWNARSSDERTSMERSQLLGCQNYNFDPSGNFKLWKHCICQTGGGRVYERISMSYKKVLKVYDYGPPTLFSYSVFRNLPQLTELLVHYCCHLEEIVQDAENYVNHEQSISFFFNLHQYYSESPKPQRFSFAVCQLQRW